MPGRRGGGDAYCLRRTAHEGRKFINSSRPSLSAGSKDLTRGVRGNNGLLLVEGSGVPHSSGILAR